MQARTPISELLMRVQGGDAAARRDLWQVVYDELRRIAQRRIAAEPRGRMLQPTALVHEAYLRLAGQEGGNLSNLRVFFAAAAKTMRRILVDDARTRKRHKRGGGAVPVALHDLNGVGAEPAADSDGPDGADVLALEEALQRLEQIDPRMAEVIELRFHGGLSREEIAETLDLAPRTVDKPWHFGRAWLHRQMSPR